MYDPNDTSGAPHTLVDACLRSPVSSRAASVSSTFNEATYVRPRRRGFSLAETFLFIHPEREASHRP
jgi:hypothetical protein